MISKKSNYDAKSVAKWLNEGLDKKSNKPSRSTVLRHDSEWTNLESFSLKDKNSVKKAKEVFEKFENQYSKQNTNKKYLSASCEYSEIELYVQLLESLECQVDKIKQQLHQKKVEIENKISKTEHYVFYNIGYKQLLHDVAYNTKKTEDLVRVVSNANLIEKTSYCTNVKHASVMTLKTNQENIENAIKADSILNIAIDAHYKPHITSHSELESYISHIPFFRSTKHY